MQEVERNVARLDLAIHDHLLELAEECARRRLGLHEPPVIERHLGLCEANGALLGGRERGERGEDVRVVIEQVRKGDVVVVDRVASVEAAARRVLGRDRR